MGHKIFIGADASYALDLLTSKLDDTSYTSVVLNLEESESSQSELRSSFNERPPSLVVNLLLDMHGAGVDRALQRAQVLGELCGEKDIPIIQVSSHYVFGNRRDQKASLETDEPRPEDELGLKLIAMEKAIQNARRHILLRSDWLLDRKDTGLLSKLLPQLISHAALEVSDHHYLSPISELFLTRSIIALIHQVLCGAENWGAFHLHSSDPCSEAELADQLVRMLNTEFGISATLPFVSTGKESQCFLPRGSNLSGRRCTDCFGIQMPTWRRGLKTKVKKWLEDARDSEVGTSLQS